MKYSKFTRLALILFAFLSNSKALALAPSENSLSTLETKHAKLADQRVHYELAKNALQSKNWSDFERYYDMLGDYPLLPYLDYIKIKSELSQLDYKKIDFFLAANKDTFLEARLRQHLLYVLGSKENWETFNSYYREEIATTELRCLQLYGRLSRNDTENLDEDIAAVWIVGKSLPKTCDPLFSAWIAADKLTSEIAWQRFTAAMEAGNVGLARYVRSHMKGRYLRYAELMLKVRAYPYTIRQRGKFLEQSREMQEVIALGIKRYARVQPVDALKQWELYEAQQLFPVEISSPVKIYLAKRLTFKGHTDLAENLIKGSSEIQSSDVIEQQLREALREENWQKVLSWLDTLSDEKQQTDRWLYWRARAQSELDIVEGPFGHFVDIYADLAAKRSFYGFLAADKLGTEYALQSEPENINPSTLVTVSALPAMRRARELWYTGNHEEAQAEWAYSIREMSSQELLAAASLARQWGWYNGGINATITGNLWDHLSLRFPLAYQTEVEKAASSTKLAPNLIYAIARQESAFSEKARSSAGAMGLMQLMPGTAQQTARKVGVQHQNKDLFDAEHNIQLGSHYLNFLLQKYNGNRILATAAYNAGPHRVNRWLKESGNISFDVWIETIPFRETRGYVQNVLSYSLIYAYRMGKSGTLITETEAN